MLVGYLYDAVFDRTIYILFGVGLGVDGRQVNSGGNDVTVLTFAAPLDCVTPADLVAMLRELANRPAGEVEDADFHRLRAGEGVDVEGELTPISA